jgi:pilus assembly protein CpaB
MDAPQTQWTRAINRQIALVALVVAALGAVLLVLYLRRFEAEKSGGDPVAVLVVTKELPAGSPVTEGVLGVREIPVAYVDSRMIKRAERDKVIGIRTIAGLEAQDALLWSDLAISSEERRDLSSLVTPGFRAVDIRATREDPGSPMIRPGDYVDVIVTLPPSDTRRNTTALVLLQRILVLASGGRTSLEEPSAQAAQGARDQGLTLSLSLHDAELIALASERGHFSVALRSPDDPRTVDDIPEMTEAALTDGRLRSPPGGKHPGSPVRLTESLGGGSAP